MMSPKMLAEHLRDGTGVLALMPSFESERAQRLAPEISEHLKSRGVVVQQDPGPNQDICLVVSLGGDGLMMRAAHRYPNIPILGLNFGHLGFMTAAEAENWRGALDRVIAGDFLIRSGPTLATRLLAGDTKKVEDLGWAVNDVVVHGGLRYIQPGLFIDGQYVNDYPGDGMVISTPAGSTAYCMAAGGPVLLSGVGGLAVVPISCHSPIRVSLIVPQDVELMIRLGGRHSASLIIDGETEKTRTVEPGDTVLVRTGPIQFHQVSFPSFDWFSAFQSKFNYQIRRSTLSYAT